MHRKQRRIIGGILIVVGGLILWLAPVESFNMGVLIILLAVFVEAAGIYLEHKRGRKQAR